MVAFVEINHQQWEPTVLTLCGVTACVFCNAGCYVSRWDNEIRIVFWDGCRVCDARENIVNGDRAVRGVRILMGIVDAVSKKYRTCVRFGHWSLFRKMPDSKPDPQKLQT
jgi:hypothetical protein